LKAFNELLALLRLRLAVNADVAQALGLTELCLQCIEDLLVICHHHQLANAAAAAAAGSSAAACSAVGCLLLLSVAIVSVITICCCCCWVLLKAWQVFYKLHNSPHFGLTCTGDELHVCKVPQHGVAHVVTKQKQGGVGL
jgi:hypothetical protein